MNAYLRKLRTTYKRLYYQRNYYLAKLWPPSVPRRPLSFLSDGFNVEPLGRSGAYVINNFCSKRGTSYLLACAAELANDDDVATVFSATRQDPVLLPLLYRAAMLAGVQAGQIGPVSVAGVTEEASQLLGERYPRSNSQPIGNIAFFLGDEGEMQLPELGVGVRAEPGRAVYWPLGVDEVSVKPATASGFTVARLIIESQVVFQADSVPDVIPQAQRGVALDGTEDLPEGAWHVHEK